MSKLDLAKLAELADIAGGDMEFLAMVVEQFAADTSEALQVLQAAHAVGDLARVSRQAHRLKSSAGVMGALDLFDRCLRVENCEGPPDAVVVEIAALAVAAHEAIAAVREHFGLTEAAAQAA